MGKRIIQGNAVIVGSPSLIADLKKDDWEVQGDLLLIEVPKSATQKTIAKIRADALRKLGELREPASDQDKEDSHGTD